MKINKKVAVPELWGWIRSRLPRGLVARSVASGYGYICCIYIAGTEPGLIGRLFDVVGNPAAVVMDREVELHEPQYLSDFEDLLRAYEAQTAVEIVLTYWEAPSPSCPRPT